MYLILWIKIGQPVNLYVVHNVLALGVFAVLQGFIIAGCKSVIGYIFTSDAWVLKRTHTHSCIMSSQLHFDDLILLSAATLWGSCQITLQFTHFYNSLMHSWYVITQQNECPCLVSHWVLALHCTQSCLVVLLNQCLFFPPLFQTVCLFSASAQGFSSDVGCRKLLLCLTWCLTISSACRWE